MKVVKGKDQKRRRIDAKHYDTFYLFTYLFEMLRLKSLQTKRQKSKKFQKNEGGSPKVPNRKRLKSIIINLDASFFRRESHLVVNSTR